MEEQTNEHAGSHCVDRRRNDREIAALRGRIQLLERKIETLLVPLEQVIVIITAASGAFKVLEFLAKLAKPVMLLGALVTSIAYLWSKHRPPLP